MDPIIIQVIIGVIALIVGIIAGKILFAKNTKKQVEEAEHQAQNILKEAELRSETIKKEKQLEAKEKFVQLKSEYDRDVMKKLVNTQAPYIGIMGPRKRFEKMLNEGLVLSGPS